MTPPELIQIEPTRPEPMPIPDVRPPVKHFHRPQESPFTESQRDETTLLFGGLTPRHERLVESALRNLGYKAKALPSTSLDAYERAKEYGNNGQCNPTYFTVGNLVKYLQDLHDAGMSREEIVRKYAFFTAGSCGTCRFGMYEAEYRFALANAGFDGFRILLFGTDDGIDQSTGERAGLELNLDFFLGLINAFNVADTLNQFVHTIRPYEVEAGSVDRVTDEALDHLYEFFLHRDRFELEASWVRPLAGTRFRKTAEFFGKLTSDTLRHDLDETMAGVRGLYDDAVTLDPFRVKPIVKIIGEFWAQTTEGAGNFHIHRFLEREGAEAYVVRSLFNRISYMLWQHKHMTRDRKGLHGLRGKEKLRVKELAEHYLRFARKWGMLTAGEKLLRRKNEKLLEALGGTLHSMPSQYELEELARPYWNWRTASGEAHLEIGENIYYHQHHLAHMVLSLKPFTCMPSTQSDGVQAKVVEKYPGMIFLPIETSGDGEVIAHSRVQMALGTARSKARREWADALARTGRTLHELKAFVADHPELTRPTYDVPHARGVVGRAAAFALHVGSLMDARPVSVAPLSGSR
ncbi:MAG: activator of (R)-2-hydroxyglutaryl-CoA dehydratase [Gemmatimonadota bacterium]|nr:activator of (R)-2-hydroxyglutaryl-CoA dehydratase [Gemmatimonadota bacterium]